MLGADNALAIDEINELSHCWTKGKGAHYARTNDFIDINQHDLALVNAVVQFPKIDIESLSNFQNLRMRLNLFS